MEKRTLIAFFSIFVFLFIWGQFTPEQDSQTTDKEEVRREQISEKEPSPQPALPPSEPKTEHLPSPETTLQETRIGDFYLSYSLQGGYIESIALGEPDNILAFKNIGFQPDKRGLEYEAVVGRDFLLFRSEEAPSKKFNFDGYLIDIEGIDNSSTLLFSFSLNSGVTRLDQRYFEVFYQKNDALERTHPKKIEEGPLLGVQLAGARSKYYAASLLAGNYNVEWVSSPDVVNLYLDRPGQDVSFYVGPQTQSQLEAYGLEAIIYYGFWHFLAIILIRILSFFYGFLNNWGLSIIFLAFSVYLLLFPFTSKSSKAMRKMQDLQPLMQEIKEKYKDKPQKMQKETIELYKKHKVNPLGGCLPLFFQAPVFISFYQVVFRFPELKGASFLWIKDLSLPDQLFRLPFTIPVLGVEYFNLIPILLVVLGIAQQSIMAGSSNPQQKKMGLFMGVFMGVIFYNFPAALVLYFLVQNLLTLIYQARLKKTRTT